MRTLTNFMGKTFDKILSKRQSSFMIDYQLVNRIIQKKFKETSKDVFQHIMEMGGWIKESKGGRLTMHQIF